MEGVTNIMSKRTKGTGATLHIEGVDQEFKVLDFTWDAAMDDRANPLCHIGMDFGHDDRVDAFTYAWSRRPNPSKEERSRVKSAERCTLWGISNPPRHGKAERVRQMNEHIKAGRVRVPHASGCTCRNDCGGFCGIDRSTDVRSYAKPSIELLECSAEGCEAWFQTDRIGAVCPACIVKLETLGDER